MLKFTCATLRDSALMIGLIWVVYSVYFQFLLAPRRHHHINNIGSDSNPAPPTTTITNNRSNSIALYSARCRFCPIISDWCDRASDKLACVLNVWMSVMFQYQANRMGQWQFYYVNATAYLVWMYSLESSLGAHNRRIETTKKTTNIQCIECVLRYIYCIDR